MKLRKGIIRSFNGGNYTATIQLSGSYKVYLEDVAVARNIPSIEVVPGRKTAVLFFDEYNPGDAVIVAVYC